VLGLIGATSGEIYYKGRDTVKFSKITLFEVVSDTAYQSSS
jgi:hypothetical protein